MDCPLGGDAVVQSQEPCVGNEASASAAGNTSLELDGDCWRNEVASRLQRYRARRKSSAPRYPSLRLPFDSTERWLPVNGSALAVSPTAAALAPEHRDEQDAPHLVDRLPAFSVEPETFNNVIEFPRYAEVLSYAANELAEPVLERPRIVEAPEVLPPPPALGGILMEPARDREPQRRPAVELALSTAPLQRRILAGVFDALILVGALAGFGAMFVWLNPQRPPLPVAASASAIIAVLLWASYEFLFTVYTGSTPGLRIARLQLVKFDGSPASRRLRRWRVLASYVSAFSLGLGYLWSVLDEEGLCWHDRITHTHLS